MRRHPCSMLYGIRGPWTWEADTFESEYLRCHLQEAVSFETLQPFFILPFFHLPFSFPFLITSNVSDLLPTTSHVWTYHPCQHLRRRWYHPYFPGGWYSRTLSHHSVTKAWSGVSISLLLALWISFQNQMVLQAMNSCIFKSFIWLFHVNVLLPH